MNQVRNFPLVFNGTKLKQTIQGFGEKINMVFELIFRFRYLLLNKTFQKESFSANLKITIEYLKSINSALVSYTKQMFQVVSDSKIVQPNIVSL